MYLRKSYGIINKKCRLDSLAQWETTLMDEFTYYEDASDSTI
jgi:hypothetical protein